MSLDDSVSTYVEDWAQDRNRAAEAMAERAEAAYLAAEVPPDGAPDLDDDETAALWQVADDFAANWALRKVGQANRELVRLQEAAEHEIAAINQWLEAASAPHLRTVSFFTGRLVDYRRHLEDENPDLPLTYKLPGGALTRRAGRARTVLLDEDALVEWATANHPEAVARKALPSKVTRADRFTTNENGDVVDTSTGEIVPGLRVTVGGPTYGVTAS